MKSRVCFIVPYFGRFPSTFEMWLECCRNNPEFNWLILTDDETDYHYPTNVRVEYLTLKDLKNMFERRLNTGIELPKPYKLCDFRALYGDLLSEYLGGFTHWGYFDVDLLFGKLSHFLKDELLSDYDKISVLGHMSILKNNKDVNQCYRKCNIDQIIKDPRNKIFDEVRHPLNINRLLIENGFKVYEDVINADIDAEHFNFYLYKYEGKRHCVRQPFVPTVFEYKDGMLNKVSVINDSIIRDEIMYVHFQKREIEVNTENKSNYYLVPNRIEECSNVSVKYVLDHSRDRLSYYLFHRVDRIKRAIKIRVYDK